MESIQTSAVDEERQGQDDDNSALVDVERLQQQQQINTATKTPPIRPAKKKRKKTEPSVDLGYGETPFEKYTKEWNSGGGDGARFKRAIRAKEKDRNTCSLFIQTDPLIWRHISEQVSELTVDRRAAAIAIWFLNFQRLRFSSGGSRC